MSTFVLGEKSLKQLEGLHPDLVKVVKRAIELTEIDFRVGEGLRTIDRQKQLFKAKATSTMNSRHLTGHAVDLIALIDGKVHWDWPLYHQLAAAMKTAAKELNVALEWGGDWKSFPDGPHFQLPWAQYPTRKN